MSKDKISNKDLRVFSGIWAVIFAFIAFSPVISGKEMRLWAVFPLAFFAFTAAVMPSVSVPLYRIWVKIGDFVGKINSYIILLLLFYVIFVPFGLVLRLFGKDLLHKKFDKNAKTYWEKRNIQPESMKNQF